MTKADLQHFGDFVCPFNLLSREDTLYYMIRRTSFSQDKYCNDLFSLKDGVQKQLTDSGDVLAYYLLEDCLVYTSAKKEEDGEKPIYPVTLINALDYETGESQQIASIDLEVNTMLFFNTERFLFTGVYSFEYARAFSQGESNRDKALKKLGENDYYQIVDELPFWLNNQGFTNKTRVRLYSCNAGLIQPLTDEYTNVKLTALSNDRKTMIYTAVQYTDRQPIHEKLFRLDVASGRIDELQVFDFPVIYQQIDFIYNDELILCCSRTDPFGVQQNPDIYRYNITNQYRRNIYTAGEYSMACSINTDILAPRTLSPATLVYGTNYYFVTTLDDSSHLMKLDMTGGAVTRLTFRKGAVEEVVPYEGGFAMTAMRGMHGCEIYRVSIDGRETLIRALNSSCDETTASQMEDVYFENERGDRIHGFMMPPAGRDKGKRFPAILYIHGGPKTAYGNVYFHELQLLTGCGYAVLFCNPTGSDGRGNEFADLRTRYGTIDYRDIMTFVDLCIDKYRFIDPARIGIAGGSYGGFMVNWIIGQTDRFRAACSMRGISNWISHLTMADVGYYFVPDQIGATPWTNIGALWDASPLKYADRVKTPTLFIHADEDYRCPLAEGIQMFTALRMNGVQARLCIYHGENHELSRNGKPLHRVQRLREIIEWFDRHLKKEPAVSGKATRSTVIDRPSKSAPKEQK